MFSFEKGIRKIARIEGGEYDGETLYLYDENYKCCSRCSETCIKSKKNICCDKCTVKTGGCGTCGGSKGKTKNVSTFEELKLKSGKIIPLPNEEPDEADHVYISGQTGAGKSSWIGNYLKDLKKKDIFLFSTFDEDKELDFLNPTRISIDEDLIDDPIQKEELTNSICIFDDIDTIRPEKLAVACRKLRDDLLQNGRKMNIKVISTSHQLMNYKMTRDLLNSSQKIVFFPEATSPMHVKRFLTTYIGLDKKSLAYVNGIKSRWIMASMTYPRYLMWETGCVLNNKISDIVKNDIKKVVKKPYQETGSGIIPKRPIGRPRGRPRAMSIDRPRSVSIGRSNSSKRVSFKDQMDSYDSDDLSDDYDNRSIKSILKRKV